MWLPLVVGGLLCVSDVPPELDAFLDSTRARPHTEGLRAEALALLDRSHVTAVEPRRGVPTILWAERVPGARSPRAQGLTSVEAARQHLLRYAAVYRLHPELVARLVVSEVHDLGRGAVIVGFARAHEGLPVLRDELDVVMTEQFELVALTGSLAVEPLPTGAFRLEAAQALSIAQQKLTGTLATPFCPSGVEDEGFCRTPGAGRALDSARAERFGWTKCTGARARRVYFDDADALWPAWHLELEVNGVLHGAVVSAVDGRLLSLAPLEAHAAYTYRVWAESSPPFRPLDSPVGDLALPHPTALPDAFAPTALTPVLVTLDHAGLSTGDPWLPAGATSLSGNNVHAYADLLAPDGLDGGDLSVAPSSGTSFDFTYALTEPGTFAPSQRAASATQAFFTTNQVHDALYDLGFTEQARNAQRDNLGRGGLGNDALLVEVHDYAGRNNATMRTPADGEAPRMHLFLFDEPRPSTVRLNGGAAIGAPSAVPFTRSWDVMGELALVSDLDGGTAGCDPWPASVNGRVVLVDVGESCSVRRRFDHALDAGAAGLVLSSDTCFGIPENTLVAVCVATDAGTAWRGELNDGGVLTARLERPPGNEERDVALDSTVVTHEYGHLLTGRLIGDSMGLMNSPARGMGEGWSDFLALWFSAKPGESARPGNDQWQGTFAIGGWSGGGPGWDGNPLPSHYYGVRRYPYSSDRTKNPLTFKHVGSNVPLPALTVAPRTTGAPDNAQVHNTGEVWASMLWDAQVKLFQKPGATVDAARLTMGRYFVAGLKATPVLPTFIEARDALLAVVAAESLTEDFPLVLDAFARRGLGVLAQSSDRRSTTNTPLAEDFTGAGGNYRLVSATFDDTDEDCDADGQLDSAETGTLTIRLMNIGSRRLTRSTLQLTSDLPALTIPATVQNLPANDPFTVVSVTLPASLDTATAVLRGELVIVVRDPDVPVLQGRLEFLEPLRLNVDLVASAKETFEAGAPGWEFHGDGTFPWEQVWFVRRVTAASSVLTGRGMDGTGSSTATSPPIVVGTGAFSVTFAHSFNFETSGAQYFDGGRLEISTDGTTFTPVPSNRLTPGYPVTLAASSNPLAGEQAWGGSQPNTQSVVANFGTDYANRTVWLRWRVGADDATGTPGWTVDDVVVAGASMPPFTEAVAHRRLCKNNVPTIAGTSSLSVTEGAPVTLVPGTVMDRDRDPLVVTWLQTSGPSVALLDASFTAPEVGRDGAVLGFRVVVDDGRGGTANEEITVTVRNVNKAPTITASAPQEVVSGETATLVAAGEDGDGDPVSYRWRQRGDSNVTLSDPRSATTSFVAPEVEVAELLFFEVEAFDPVTASPVATVEVRVTPKPRSCGCMTVEPLLGMGVLILLRGRRKRG
jgi:hypothetical protein